MTYGEAIDRVGACAYAYDLSTDARNALLEVVAGVHPEIGANLVGACGGEPPSAPVRVGSVAGAVLVELLVVGVVATYAGELGFGPAFPRR